MHPWTKSIVQRLEPIGDQQDAAQMKAYMRGQFEFLGIKSEPRRTAVKSLFAKEQLPAINETAQVVDELWNMAERDYQLVAIDLLIKRKRQLPGETLPDLERWIITKSWWDTVDMLATHIAGNFFQRNPTETNLFLQRWQVSDNIWLRRTTILYQLKYKQQTDQTRLFEIIKHNQDDKEFFIQKAIGWALREYSKTNPDAVIKLINDQNIEGLAKREGLKWLKSHNNLTDS